MSSNEQIKFQTDVCFIPSLGIIKSSDSTQKLNLAEQYILTFLINHHDRPVTKEELLKAGWPDRIVTEASLFQVIRALRVKLQENRKGDVIETLPRVGYQITRFERLEFHSDTAVTEKNKPRPAKRWFLLTFVLTLIVFGLASYWRLNHFQPPKQTSYLTSNEQWNDHALTLIATNQQDLDDLRQKLKPVYQKIKSRKISNSQIFAYKGDGLYSIAWCRLDDNNACIPHSDFSYTVEDRDWNKVARFLESDIKIPHKEPFIQSDLAREPTSQVFMHYMDDSGVHSKIVHHYISKDDSGDLNYSYMSFITENETGFHHALSIRAATLSIIDNHSPFLAMAELKPDMFHWAYQPNETIMENRSAAILTEARLRDDYKAKRIVYSYLLYQQPYLDLIFYPEIGIYWVHNSVENTKLFDYKRYTPETK